MHFIDAHNAESYLRDSGWVGRVERIEVRTLSGGVSNEVLYVARPDRAGEDFVVKQARPQLRVPDPWFCGVERIWREVDVLKTCGELLAGSASGEPLAVQTPRILHEDRENFSFAMTAAPPDNRVWKADLLAGQIDPAIATACGRLLGRLHARSWNDPAIEAQLGDRKIFDELRLDPYYRTVALRFPDDAAAIDRLVESVWEHRRSLVHGDFSPKNLLLWSGQAARSGGQSPTDTAPTILLPSPLRGRGAGGEGDAISSSDASPSPQPRPGRAAEAASPVKGEGARTTTCLMMVDFETGHYGDPAFDIGFFLSHLVLKAFYHAGDHERYLALTERFWDAYASELADQVGPEEYQSLVARGILNFAGCAWARLDGKSKVEYLSDPVRRDHLRGVCRQLLHEPVQEWQSVLNKMSVVRGP